MRRPNGSRLLAQIVRRSPRMGLHTHAERLLLTHGAMEALQLALRAVTQPGDAVGIERRPTSTCIRCWPTSACRPSSCPPTRSTDWTWMHWMRCWSTGRWPHVVMPTVHNPLGCTMPTAAKQRLAELVNARQLPLIEDAVRRAAVLRTAGTLAESLRSRWLGDGGRWLLKDTGAGLPHRLAGWRRFAERIAPLKFQSTGGEPQLLGDAVAAYLEAGSYEHHLHRMRRLYREQVGRLRQLVAEHFPAGTRATEPQGGFRCGWNCRAWTRASCSSERCWRTSCSCRARCTARRTLPPLPAAVVLPEPGCALHRCGGAAGCDRTELAAAAR